MSNPIGSVQINFTPLLRDELRATYENAIAANAEQFTFHSREYRVEFTKYLLEHLDSQLGTTAPGEDRYKLRRAVEQINRLTTADADGEVKWHKNAKLYVVAHWGEQDCEEMVLDLADLKALAEFRYGKFV